MNTTELNKIDIPENVFAAGTLAMTIDKGELSEMSKEAYNQGWLLLQIEYDEKGNEEVTAAYKKP